MDDLEITKLCAEAMGLDWIWEGPEIVFRADKMRDAFTKEPLYRTAWEPLRNDAQAMALVKKFRLYLDSQFFERPDETGKHSWHVSAQKGHQDWPEAFAIDTDLNRAICECVAKMQKAKPG